MIKFNSKLERDQWIQKASDDKIIQYFEQHKPELLVKARKTMSDKEIVEWCRTMADFTVAGQETFFK